ncbi:unnamed protein product [Schistosoma margrebowiei]|nr:unnamed protein product [Schistosoma margrebowiei]
MAPRAIQILYKACTKYNTWKKSNNPDYKPWLYPGQTNLPLLCWDDLDQTANLGPTDDGGDVTPLPSDEPVLLDRNGSYNSREEQEDVEEVVEFDSVPVEDQIQSCVTATSIATVSDSR